VNFISIPKECEHPYKFEEVCKKFLKCIKISCRHLRLNGFYAGVVSHPSAIFRGLIFVQMIFSGKL
jgi:hypothetical protein